MPELLKDSIFSRKNVLLLAELINKIDKKFPVENFMDKVFSEKWNSLELKERMRQVTLSLNEILNLNFEDTISLLYKVCDDYKGFYAMVLPDYVEVFGLNHLELSKKALKKFTSSCSSEFAVRPFIMKYTDQMIQEMYIWSKDKNHHVRRLASEGCRPRLPWAIALPEFKKNPSAIIPILEELKNDESEYVRKSVANNLNDISKDNPDVVLDLCRKWYGKSEKTDWIVKHGLRTLLKKGNEEALNIFQISKTAEGEVVNLETENQNIKIGDDLFFSFDFKNKSKNRENFRLEYKIEFKKANGSFSGKVFQITEFEMEPGGSKHFGRKFSFKQRTTRKLYPGEHILKIIINGIESKQLNIMLEA